MEYIFKQSKFWFGYSTITQNYKNYCDWLERVRSISNPEERMREAYNAALHATWEHAGIFCSPQLEQLFLELAGYVGGHCSAQHKPRSVLHVYSYVFQFGGHTRVCERWIKGAPDNEQHSVLVLQHNDMTENLQNAVYEHNGQIYDLSQTESYLKKAKRLREIASDYEKIILYTGENEGLVISAFGVPEFTRPVIYYNQADHHLWLGTCVADVVADIRKNRFTPTKRFVDRYCYLGIPMDDSISVLIKSWDKQTIRKELGMPMDKFICISTGSEWKYSEIGTYSFRYFVENLSCYDICVYIIGVKSLDWLKSQKRAKDNIYVLDYVLNREMFYKYLFAADCYIDSFPMGGGTARSDATQLGLPVLGLTISSQDDFLLGKTPFEKLGVYYTERELKNAILHYKENKNDLNRLSEMQMSELEDENGDKAWQERLHNVYRMLPMTHSIYPIDEKDKPIADDLAVCLDSIYAEPRRPYTRKKRIRLFCWKLIRNIVYLNAKRIKMLYRWNRENKSYNNE